MTQNRQGSRGRPARGRGDRAESGSGGEAVIYGIHPVAEALVNPRRSLRRLLVTENAADRLSEAMAGLSIQPEMVRPDEISRLVEPDAVHQGVLLYADPLEPLGLDDLGPDALVLALDQITDPHNVGAITRTAAAFGVDALLTTNRHSPSATGVLAKAASGGIEHVPAIVVQNLAEALIELGRRAFQRVGLDSEGNTALAALSPTRPTVLVLGAEGRGLRQRTRQCCDVVARIDMPGAIRSLNVSNAAAIALYALAARPTNPTEGG